MSRRQTQYTIRGVPAEVDNALRERARRYGRSLNAVALEALERGLGLTPDPARHHDLDSLAGTWVDDTGFDRAIEEMDRVDDEQWR